MIKNCENIGIKHSNDPNAFIKCSNTMDDIYENIDDYNASRKKIIIVFDDVIADITSNKKFQAIINIPINHSADIDYKDFMKFTENIQKNHVLF